MTSSSSLGTTRITIQFDLNRNIDGAALDVQTALAIAQRRLPVEMTTPPSFRKVNPGDFPVLFISLSSPTLPLSTVNEYAETVLAPADLADCRASRRCWSMARRNSPCACRSIRSRRRRATSRSTTSAPCVAKANSNAPVGTICGQRAEHHAAGDRRDATRPRTTRMSSSPGATARRSSSSEVASVIDSVENDKVASWFNDERAIVLAIQRQPDANTVEVVDSVQGQAAGVPRADSGLDRDGVADRPLGLDPRGRLSTCRRRW